MNRKEHVLSTPSGHSQPIHDMRVSGDGRLLATLGGDQLIRLWSFDSRSHADRAYRVQGRKAKGIAFSNDGTRLAAGDDTGLVHLWRLGKHEDPIILRGHGHQVWAAAFSEDGSLLASGDRNGKVRLWDGETGALRREINGHGEAVWSIGFTSDGQRLITASDTRASLWDTESGSLLADLRQEDGRLTRAVLSPNGTVAAIAGTDGKVQLWDLDQGKVVKEIDADDDVVWSVAFSPDAEHLATASSDEVVALWDIATGERLAVLTGHTGGATDVAFLADGVTLVAIDRGGGLHFWDLPTGRRLSPPLEAHSGASWRLALHPDGERLATAGDDGLVRVWDDLNIARACDIGGLALDETRRLQYLGEGERSLACDPES